MSSTSTPIDTDTPARYASRILDLRDILDVHDGAQWLAGDAINQIRADFPDMTMEDIADDAAIGAPTCYEYASMSAFWAADLREHYARAELKYSHLRLAKRLIILGAACDFLDLCALNHWSVRYAAMELAKMQGKTVPPPPLSSIPVTLTYERGRWVIDGLADLDRTRLHNATLRIAP